jgi:hypothetical protein
MTQRCALESKDDLKIHKPKMDSIRDILSYKLITANRFWSNDTTDVKQIPDEILIEKTLVYLDIEDINQLFKIFSKKKIKQVWRERLIIQGDYYRTLNRLLAWLYFDVKNPEKYLNRIINNHYKKLRQLQISG